MTIADMLGQSAILTLTGMSMVFGFLVVLVLAVTLMGKVIHSLGLDKAPAKPAPRAAPPAAPAVSAGNDQAAITAAISAAITEYRKTGNR